MSTIKASVREIAEFSAYHLDLGASRLIIYLDDNNTDALEQLGDHPALTLIPAGPGHRIGAHRPVKRQVRQCTNATQAYCHEAQGLDWLCHIDVDEFILPDQDLAQQLKAMPETALCTRMLPAKALGRDNTDDGAVTWFKKLTPERARRDAQSETIYPTFGSSLNTGFLSHIEGKVFVRTGLRKTDFRIHNVLIDGQQNPGQVLFGGVLLHIHAPDYKTWRNTFDYRHEKGAYRPDIGRKRGRTTMHDLLALVKDDAGEEGLRAFYEEVCLATPRLRRALSDHGLLLEHRLDLAAKCRKHFPDHS